MACASWTAKDQKGVKSREKSAIEMMRPVIISRLVICYAVYLRSIQHSIVSMGPATKKTVGFADNCSDRKLA
jgi:hypothetical protein